MKTECQWRQLPKDFLPWKVVYGCNSHLKKVEHGKKFTIS
ncbi:transposase [Wolbachia endosymbiont of Encarsia formosa]